MQREDDRVRAARRLLHAIEQGDAPTLLTLYAQDAVQIEHPNRLKPKGDRRAPEAMVRDLARGKQLLREEHYDVIEITASGDRVALRVKWTGVLAVPLGGLQPGDEMVCESGIFLRFEGERIAEQHNYDCFEDFGAPRG
jgi:ketosteroid isomerase-like protein